MRPKLVLRVVWIAYSTTTISNEWFSTRKAARMWADAEERETGVRFHVCAFERRTPQAIPETKEGDGR